jgi:hypothetical protein
MRANITTVGAKPLVATIGYLSQPAFDGTRVVRLDLAAPIKPGTPVTIELASR